MPYLSLEDFKFGLDTRKFMLNSPPGTLTALVNAHITPGGEAEKRMAFTRQYLPANCFGLEVTSSGFTVFGSVAEGSLAAPSQVATTHRARASNVATLTFASHSFAAGDTINVTGFTSRKTAFNATGATVLSVTSTTITYANIGSDVATAADTAGRAVLDYTLPDGVTYQRLQHPDGTSAMTAVVHSTIYNGKAFVIADFGAGGIVSFYDGVVVDDLSPGKLATILADADALASYMAGLINATTDYTATVVNGTVTIVGSQGATFSVQSSNDSQCDSPVSDPDVSGVAVTACVLTLTIDTLGPNIGYTVEYDSVSGGTHASPGGTVTTVTSADPPAWGDVGPHTIDIKAAADGLALTMYGGGQLNIGAGAAGYSFTGTLHVEYADGSSMDIDFVPTDFQTGEDTFWTHNPLVADAVSPAITETLLSSGVLPVSGVIPQAQFAVTAVGASGNVTSIMVDKGGAHQTEILGANVPVEATTAEMATAIKDQINTYCNANNLDFIASVSGSIVVVRASNPAAYSTWTGKSLTVEVDGGIAIGKLGVAFSQIPGSATVPTVTALILGGANILTSGTITGTDLADFVSNLAADINPASGYCGVAIDEVLYLSRLITSSSDAPKSFNCVISDGLFSEVTGSGGTGTGGSAGLYASLSYVNTANVRTSNYLWTRSSTSYSNLIFTSKVVCAASGGTPPYTFDWTYGTYSGNPADTLVQQQGNYPEANYALRGVRNPHPVLAISCKVTDSLGNTITTGNATIQGVTA